MENNASISEFGSLLRSPEEKRHSNPEGKEIAAFEVDNVSAGETDLAAGQRWDTTNVLPLINQGFGNTIFGQKQTALNVEQDQATVESGDFAKPQGKLSLAFNQDMLNNPNRLQNTNSTDPSADGHLAKATAIATSDILSPQANVNLGNGPQIGLRSTVEPAPDILSPQADVNLGIGSQIGIVSPIGAPDMVDGRPVNKGLLPAQTGEVIDGNKFRNHHARTAEEFQLRSQIRENAVSNEIFPSSDKGLLKLQSLQPRLRSEIEELVASSAKPSKSDGSERTDVQFAAYPAKSEASKPAPTLSPLLTNSGEQQDARSGKGQSGFQSSPQDSSPIRPASQLKPAIADGEFAEPAKLDLPLATKSLEISIDQQPITNSSAQMAVRATIQKPVPFDMSTPQIAERLAAEIADISVTGGSKKFEINPRNLGRMEITFTTRGSAEIIEIQTEHRAAKDVIVQHSQMLQDILKSSGRDDLTFRVDVKENMFASTRNDGASLSQQENRDTREQQARPSPRRQTASSFDSTTENDPESDNSRYA
ncbi:MAG: hypothetical protein WBM39_01820 [Parasphingorhabdus sp.]